MNPQDLQLPGLETADRIRLLANGTSRPFASGETLIAEGARQPHVLLLLGGEVAVLQGSREITRLRRGAVVGEMGWLADAPATASLVARSPGQLLALDPDGLPDTTLTVRLRRALNRVLVRRLREANARLPELATDTLAERAWRDAPGALDDGHGPVHPVVAPFVARFEALVGHPAWWRWAAQGLEPLTLITVPEADRPAQLTTKLLAMLLDLTLAELAVRHPEQLEAALRLPFEAPPDQPWLSLVADLWDAVWARAATLPAFERHRALLAFDWQQVFNGLRYSHLLRTTPALLNPAERGHAGGFGLNLLLFSTLDLMASPTFDLAELGPLRDALCHGRRLGQIANMVVTWHAEDPHHDAGQRLFALALTRAVVNLGDLDALPEGDLIERLRDTGLEDELIEAWQGHRRSLLQVGAQLHTLPLDTLLGGLEVLLGASLAARGWV